MKLQPNEIFIDDFSDTTYYFKDGQLHVLATRGAPFGTQIDGVDASEIAAGHIDFNKNNNRITAEITEKVSNLTCNSTSQGDGSANTKLTWDWFTLGLDANEDPVELPDARKIDGFLIQIHEATTNDAYTFPEVTTSDFSAVAVKFIPGKLTYSYTHNGVMNQWLKFNIIPFRSIDAIGKNPAKTLVGPGKETGLIRPFDTLKFDDINITELKITATNITEDGVIEPIEKLAVIKPYLARISTDPKSEYELALAKVPPGIDQIYTGNLTDARDALNILLTSEYFEAKPNNSPSLIKSTLVEGENWKKTHVIPDKVAFHTAFDNYDAALNSLTKYLTDTTTRRIQWAGNIETYLTTYPFTPRVGDEYLNLLTKERVFFDGANWVADYSGMTYNVTIESTNGFVFRVGEARTTILSARVFRNGVEITDTIPSSSFSWRRVSIIGRVPPFDDTTWNTEHSSGYKQIVVDIDEVSSRASFFCDVTV